MNEICKMCGIDCTKRKITNHTGRKTLVQGLQKLGFSRDSMKLATRHRNIESLDSYELPRDQEQIGMLSNLVDNIHNNTIKRKREESDANKLDNTKKIKGFSTAKEDFIFQCEISKTNDLKEVSDDPNLRRPLQEIDSNNTNLEITMNTNNLANLINSGILKKLI
ncbi:hypothetical protein RclHR1_02200005 [Rhizophagus clarus]|uniref:Uncharacterized protein n=1 Tax=Rhizophagus clarus TaxID=94130 RepID=A0A2Z6R762_9GLOM|nr:hypothetical protein RclHR1_02200005 [Rhizophagus clarus]